MFITYNPAGLVTAYSDKLRNEGDLMPEEKQVRVDIGFQHISCKEDGLTFEDGQLLNEGEVIANEIN